MRKFKIQILINKETFPAEVNMKQFPFHSFPPLRTFPKWVLSDNSLAIKHEFTGYQQSRRYTYFTNDISNSYQLGNSIILYIKTVK